MALYQKDNKDWTIKTDKKDIKNISKNLKILLMNKKNRLAYIVLQIFSAAWQKNNGFKTFVL